MANHAGEIYFVRELDRSGGFTNFVKMGLVKYAEGRDSFTRLMEHQTGNPRKLHLDAGQIVKTVGVNIVEALLHRTYATTRISGEWFEFESEEQINQAVAKARELAAAAELEVPFIERAEPLATVVSEGETKSATDEDKANGKKLAVAKAQLKVCKALKDELDLKVALAKEAGANVDTVVKDQIVNYKPTFEEERFKAENPELWEQYLEETSKVTGSFRLLIKLTEGEPLGVEFEAGVSSVRAAIDACTSHELVGSLNDAFLTVTQLKGLAEWDETVADARLRVATGTAPGIEGVCAWARAVKVTPKFNEGLFASENPELAKQYLSAPRQVTRTKAIKKKA